MGETFYLQFNSKTKIKASDTPSNFHIDLPSCLHRDNNPNQSRSCFQIVHMNIQGMWNLSPQQLNVRKTLISPILPSIDTELTIEGGNYTLDTIITTINLLAVNIFKIEKYKNSITSEEHIELINLQEKTAGVFSSVLEMPYMLAAILGFVLPRIAYKNLQPQNFGLLLFGFCKDIETVDPAGETASAPSVSTLHQCTRDDSVNITIPTFDTFQNLQGEEIVFQGDFSPSIQNNLTELKININGDYLIALPKVLRSPNYSYFTAHHTLCFFHPHWNTLLKTPIPGTITLFPTVHQSVWLQFQSKLLNFTLTDISGNDVPIDPRGQIELVIKVTRQIASEKH